MTNRRKLAVLAAALSLMVMTEAALALPINRCVRLVRNPQVDRVTILNVCSACIVAKVSRQRPGNATGTPTVREFTLLPGNQLVLPFKGPGQTRLVSELPCRQVRP